MDPELIPWAFLALVLSVYAAAIYWPPNGGRDPGDLSGPASGWADFPDER